MHQIAQICTHIFKKFSGVTPPDPHNWGYGKPDPSAPSASVNRPTSELLRPLAQVLQCLAQFLSYKYHHGAVRISKS